MLNSPVTTLFSVLLTPSVWGRRGEGKEGEGRGGEGEGRGGEEREREGRGGGGGGEVGPPSHASGWFAHVKRRLPHQQCVEHAAQGPDVRLQPMGLPAGHLPGDRQRRRRRG